MKIKGHEFDDFLENGWPGPDWYHDEADDSLFDESTGKLKDPLATYNTEDLGCILWQGEGDDPTDGDGKSLDSAIRKWRKEKTTFSFIVSGRLGDRDALEQELKIRGFKVS